MSETQSMSGVDEPLRCASNDGENGGRADGVPTTSVFIGLGPAASTIKEEMLRERLEEVTPVLGVRIRGRCAFADVPDADAAERLVAELDGKHIGEARMSVQISRTKEKPRARTNGHGGGRASLFVGLGPAGNSITDKELRSKLEEVAPITAFRRRGQCAFVDVAEAAHATRMIRELNNQYIGDCRLSVQYSRDKAGGRLERRRSDSPHRRRRRRSRRSDSPDRRRHRRRRSYSYSSRSSSSRRSSNYSDDSRDHRRRDKRDRRRDRRRSRSYSSRSRSSSLSYRRRRD